VNQKKPVIFRRAGFFSQCSSSGDNGCHKIFQIKLISHYNLYWIEAQQAGIPALSGALRGAARVLLR
jgi:hypothetical protein